MDRIGGGKVEERGIELMEMVRRVRVEGEAASLEGVVFARC